ncbi:MAG: efflux RND transporter periplasmic adaptor subunit [Ferruginibacter sp.]|nr:efflux RND transporter periplasmic adaptor subunit [Ferruginibacter sp.]
MKQITQFATVLLVAILLASCGSETKKEKGQVVADMKARLEKLRAQKDKTEEEIQALQTKLESLDPSSTANSKVRLVAISPVETKDFLHYIDLQGTVDAQNISYIAPRGMGGQVKALFVKEGQAVKKGQLLLKLDDAIMQQQVAAAKQQLETIKTQLSFAKNLYQRQKNLWDQGIGTEVQLITARTNAETLENQLKSAQEQVKVAVEQMNTTNVLSDVDGIADIVNIRVGEQFIGMTQAGPQIKIVNKSNLKVVTSIPENYLTKVQKGSPVIVSIPDAQKDFNSVISLISQSIDPTQRGFIAEAKIPSDPALKPNQTAVIRINDYKAANAIVVPVNSVQSDETGKFVFLVNTEPGGKMIARKQAVTIGEVYGNNMEIKAGLKAGDQLITEGFQNVYDGQTVATANP